MRSSPDNNSWFIKVGGSPHITTQPQQQRGRRGGGGQQIIKVLELDQKGFGVGSQRSPLLHNKGYLMNLYTKKNRFFFAKIQRIKFRLNLLMPAPPQCKQKQNPKFYYRNTHFFHNTGYNLEILCSIFMIFQADQN